MGIFKVLGILAAFAVILLIDRPKLEAAGNKKKYKAVYYSIVAVGILIGVLSTFDLIPHFDVIIVDYYKKMTGSK
jgi:hypothetical protein